MHIAINTGDARPIYLQIMDEVRRAIVLGILAPEDALPSVRQLASELRLNPNTVAHAYRELERDSVVYVRRGQGTFVSPEQPSGPDRSALIRGVAERALIDAHRHGVRAEELIEAILAATRATEPRSGATT
jgi:GntR family transcriptional regulator